MEKKEQVEIVYKDDKIYVKGATIKAELSVSSSELSKVYWGSKGKGTLKITVS